MLKPILFKTEMVRAILAGRKTVTRRICKSDKPPCKAGDVLWVRETWDFLPCVTCGERRDCPENHPGRMETADGLTDGCFLYRATDGDRPIFGTGHLWRPSMHMPKAAARIFLKVTSVRYQNIQDITDEEAKAEGLGDRREFVNLWITMTPKDRVARDGWAANPDVWVIRFEVCEKPKGWPG